MSCLFSSKIGVPKVSEVIRLFLFEKHFTQHIQSGNSLFTVSYRNTSLPFWIFSACTMKSSEHENNFFIANVSTFGGSSLKYHIKMCVDDFKRFYKDFTCNVCFNIDQKIIIVKIRLNIFVQLLAYNISQTLDAMSFVNKGTCAKSCRVFGSTYAVC